MSGTPLGVDMLSDDLTRPLGTDRPVSRRSGPTVWPRLAASACIAVTLAGLGYAAWLGDPLGGRPHARVEIAVAPPPPGPSASVATPDTSPSAEPVRRNASEVETSSGVSVVRPAGTAAPASVIVRVPDDHEARIGPDPRLVDRTRYGPLPRIGPDGARPLEIYARPVGTLPGGAVPAGRVAIVVGGLGIGQAATADALAKLPPAVTLAIAPYGTDLDRVAARARAAGHEILLQVPMEPFDYPDSDPGPHTLTVAAGRAETLDHLHWAMGRLTGYVGLVNYMGGKLTADPAALGTVLREAGSRGLAFLDDGSSSRSLVTAVAGDTRAARADIVVDANSRPDQIDRALERLETLARSSPIAIGTATALPGSVERIRRWAEGLEGRGILLVPVSAALRSTARGSASR